MMAKQPLRIGVGGPMGYRSLNLWLTRRWLSIQLSEQT
jgi:hypothetical protein